MPFAPRFALVPFFGERADTVYLPFNLLWMFRNIFFRVVRGMLTYRHACKIVNIVVVFVLILVMDVESVRHWPIKIPPHIAMQPFALALISRFICQIIPGFRVSAEFISVKVCSFLVVTVNNSFHHCLQCTQFCHPCAGLLTSPIRVA